MKKTIQNELVTAPLAEKMSAADFWKIVDLIDWPSLVDQEAADPNFNAVVAGKNKFIELFITPEAVESFITTHKVFTDDLYMAFDKWGREKEKNDPAFIGWDIGDDGFGDLISHIVGCGSATYYREMHNPELAYARIAKTFAKNSNAQFKRSEGFVEKFSYCFPYPSDYIPTQEKITSIEQNLKYWLSEAGQDYFDEPKGGKDGACPKLMHIEQVAYLLAEKAGYEEKLATNPTCVFVFEPNKEQIRQQMLEAEIQVLKSVYAIQVQEKISAIYKLRIIEDRLQDLGVE